MNRMLETALVLALLSQVGFAQSDCEARPTGEPPDRSSFEEEPRSVQDPGLASTTVDAPDSRSASRPPVDDPRQPFESLPEEGERGAGVIPELLNGTFRAPAPGFHEPSPDVTASVCEEIGDWKGAAEGYERAGSWPKAAENWERLGHDLDGLGLRAEAALASARADGAWRRAGGRPIAGRRPTPKRAKEPSGRDAEAARRKAAEEARQRAAREAQVRQGVAQVKDAVTRPAPVAVRVVRLVRGMASLWQGMFGQGVGR